MLKIAKIRKVKTPERSGKNAGFDFFVPDTFKKTSLHPRMSIVIPSGIKIRIPENYCLIGFNKSSIGSKGLIIGACVIDENYTGEIHINIINTFNHSNTFF